MASVARIPYVSVETYLSAGDLQPDMDYVDGVLEGRNLGEIPHATLQGVLFAFLFQRRKEWKLAVYPEARVQVTSTRFRVPDVCVMPAGWSKTQVIAVPPLLCLEILSEEDTLSRQRYRCDDYLRMGVAEVWIFDPIARTAYVQREGSFEERASGTLQLAGTAISLPLAEIFAALDE